MQTLSQVQIQVLRSELARRGVLGFGLKWTWGKNCQRSTFTKFSEAELARRGELGASAPRAVLFKSQLSTPSFWLDLMLVHRTKEVPLPKK